MGFEILPHTADLRAITRARDLAGLYESAAALLRAIVVGDSPVEERESHEIEIEEPGSEEGYFRFVRELLFLYDAEAFLPARVELGQRVRVWGERFAADRHHSERQVKALTRHGYRLTRDPERGYRAELLFDL